MENKGLNTFDLADKYLDGETLYYYKGWQLAVEAKTKANKNINLPLKIAEFIAACPFRLINEGLKSIYHETRQIYAGMKAPDFTLKDINGKTVSLADYRNAVILLDFWATWCIPCVHQLPLHQQLKDQFSNQNVVFLYVSVDKNQTSWRRFVQGRNLSGVHLTAGKEMFNADVAKNYKLKSLPTTMLIDPNGTIVWYQSGGYSLIRLEQRIAQLLQ